jgi:Zn finger protein HypA/HybF involved in hydrogenase expression
VPRPLLLVVVVVIVFAWLQRVARSRSANRTGPLHASGMPKHLVCGACGRQYDPQASGWICPQCHK